MPTYYTGGVNIRLSAAEFHKTVTSKPARHHSKESSANVEKALKEFEDHGRTLAETTLRNPDGHRLGFLGEYKNMPFLMVRASHSTSEKTKSPPLLLAHNDSQDSPLSELSLFPRSPFPTSSNQAEDRFGSPSFQLHDPKAQRHEKSKSPEPQALCLRILSTRRTFHTVGKPRKVKWGHSDMKIDIFLNGDLCSSAYIAESAFHKKEPLRNTFSGAKIDRMAEKPWILVADDRIGPNDVAEDVASRWNEIAQAHKLAAESHKRNEKNEMSCLGDYLQSLASLPMPATLPELLETGNKRFAIIDVVITAGRGRKQDASTPYLMRPTPLKLHRFGTHREGSPIRVSPRPITPPPQWTTRERSIHPPRSAADAEILSQQFSLKYVGRGSAGRVTRRVDNHENHVSSPAHRDGHYTKGQLTIPGHSIMEAANAPSPLATPAITHVPESRPQLQSPPILLPHQSNQVKRRRMLYHDVIDTRQTREEELNDIMQQAVSLNTDRLITRSRLADTAHEPHDLPKPLPPVAADRNSIVREPLTSTRMVTLRYGSPTRFPAPQATTTPSILTPICRKRALDLPPRPPDTYTADASSPEQPLMQLRHTTPNDKAHASTPAEESLRLDVSSIPRFPAAPAIGMKIDTASVDSPVVEKKKGEAVEGWVVPEASKGAVVRYAEGDVVRQVRSERGGWFREDEVLVGMRFVVG
ncbi:MAG: hypothetical protein Q9224_004836 [Gallowayella concinna]